MSTADNSKELTSRPYASAGGFYIGDRVEVHLPRRETPTRGWVRDISPDKLAVVELDSDGGTWQVADESLTRIEG